MSNKKLEALDRLLTIMDRLRIECPWDREQTMESLRNNTIEECFELTDAILDGDLQEIRKELGDLLLQIVFYAKIGEEQGAFDIGDVANSIADKLVYRHPHVFSTVEVENAADVTRNWEQLKMKEKGGNKSVLSGVPRGMPSLPKAFRIGQKAAAVGFDWEKREDVWAKVKEEIAEVEHEIQQGNQELLEKEFGDVLFAICNAARLYGVNPDTALEKTNRKFINRFNYLEDKTIKQGTPLTDLTLNQMNVYWDEAKKLEKNGNN